MSILGYSTSYFLPSYWAETPLYGEKIIPLLDYLLSSDYAEADKLANAFYNMENKYKNTGNLPIEQIEALIEESGYGYVRDLLGNDEESIRLLVYLIVLVHQLKGTKIGIQVVLNLLRKEGSDIVLGVVGNPTINANNEVSNITTEDYVQYTNFTTDNEPFELTFPIRTGALNEEQCIASTNDYGFSLRISSSGRLLFYAGNNKTSWNIADRVTGTGTLLPNTNYYIRLSYTGYEYIVRVSEDGVRFTDSITLLNSEPLNLHRSVLYIGVDGSSGTMELPFKGYINLGPFSVNVDNIQIEQWYEQLPVGNEDTFIIKADLDISLVSSDFFKKFSDFLKRYVYPSLEAFEAKIKLENNLTILPFSRQKITYVSISDSGMYTELEVLNSEGTDYEAFETNDGEGGYEPFNVVT